MTEPDLLAAHGIVVWNDRVIFEAQPPIDDAELNWISERCAGPLPTALVALWRRTAGGALDYDLPLAMNGRREAISWGELFFTGSSGYRDLRGWIEHEFELLSEAAAERGAAAQDKLDYLPIGGFEYCDRIYVVVKPGPEYGHVLAWKQGLPPAWSHHLHEDAVATVAPTLEAAFAALQLQYDPLARPPNQYTGETLLAYLDERVESHGLGRDAADEVLARYRAAMRDWRTPLAAGRLHESAELSALALQSAIDGDDAALVGQLARAGVSLEQVLAGDAVALECAIGSGQFQAAAALLAQRVAVPSGILSDLNRAAPVDLVTALMERGATPSLAAAVVCAEHGATDSARVILRAAQAAGKGATKEFDRLRDQRIAELTENLEKMRTGKFGHYLGVEGLEEHRRALQSFESGGAATLLGIRLPWRRG